MPLLNVHSLAKTYDDGGAARTLFTDLNFSVEAGELLVLWGPSGSGKSTLLNILAGVLVADAGSVELHCANGERWQYGQLNLKNTAAIRRSQIGYVFQFFNLVPTLTVAENTALAVRLAASSPGQRESSRTTAQRMLADATALSERLGLTHLQRAFPETLSGGEQQRAAIVRALAAKPSLVLADEPTGNLDATNAAQVMDALLEQAVTQQCALVVATHDAAIAERATRVLTLPC